MRFVEYLLFGRDFVLRPIAWKECRGQAKARDQLSAIGYQLSAPGAMRFVEHLLFGRDFVVGPIAWKECRWKAKVCPTQTHV